MHPAFKQVQPVVTGPTKEAFTMNGDRNRMSGKDDGPCLDNNAFGSDIAAVAIGRNEGERLKRCLAALVPQVRRAIYVDSGSTDGSGEAASALGAEVVELDMSAPFTAARARNTGFACLVSTGMPDAVQFIDGDCELVPGWAEAALAFLASRPDVAIVTGRLRERFPEKTIYNRLCDMEWDGPVGEIESCGGIFMARAEAFADEGGFRDDLIAGEEPELCLRLRRGGWKIWRLDRDTALHDADMTRFDQWWRRSRRAGHAFAEGAALHGDGPERYGVPETRRGLLWGVGLPAAMLGMTGFVSPWFMLLFLLYPLQMLRLSRRFGWLRAAFLVLGKFPEGLGVLEYHLRRWVGKRRGLIEYK